MPPTTSWSALTGRASNQTSIATTYILPEQIAYDTFSNGAAGAVITSRSGEQATWNAHPSYGSTFHLTSASRAHLTSAVSHGCAYLSENTGADYRMRARLRWVSDPSSGIFDGGVAVRSSTTADTMYLMWWQNFTDPGVHLYRLVDGVGSDLTKITTLAEPTIGTNYDFDLQAYGSRITATVSVAGVQLAQIAASDTSITAAGRGALRAFNGGAGTDHTGLHFDDVNVYTFASNVTSIATAAAPVPSWTARADVSSSWVARSDSTASWVLRA